MVKDKDRGIGDWIEKTSDQDDAMRRTQEEVQEAASLPVRNEHDAKLLAFKFRSRWLYLLAGCMLFLFVLNFGLIIALGRGWLFFTDQPWLINIFFLQNLSTIIIIISSVSMLVHRATKRDRDSKSNGSSVSMLVHRATKRDRDSKSNGDDD